MRRRRTGEASPMKGSASALGIRLHALSIGAASVWSPHEASIGTHSLERVWRNAALPGQSRVVGTSFASSCDGVLKDHVRAAPARRAPPRAAPARSADRPASLLTTAPRGSAAAARPLSPLVGTRLSSSPRRDPIVTGNSVLAVKYNEGVLVITDTGGRRSTCRACRPARQVGPRDASPAAQPTTAACAATRTCGASSR